MIYNGNTKINNLIKIEPTNQEYYLTHGYTRNGNEIHVRTKEFSEIVLGKYFIADAVIEKNDLVYLAKISFYGSSPIRQEEILKENMTLDEALLIISISDKLEKDRFSIEETNFTSYSRFADSTINAKYFANISDVLSNLRINKTYFDVDMNGFYTESETSDYGNTTREYNVISGKLGLKFSFENNKNLSDLVITPNISSKRDYCPEKWGAIY